MSEDASIPPPDLCSRVRARARAATPAAHRARDGLLATLAREGVDASSTTDLVAALLHRRGDPAAARGDAAALLARFGPLRRLAAATLCELESAGVTRSAAATLAASFALARRAAAERLERGTPFRSSRDIYERFHPALRDARRERFLAVLLDGKNRVLREEQVSEGSLTASLVHPREVFAPAIRESAAGLVFVHNHPSGDPEPSPEDVEITRRLCAVGELVGIRVLDHVVIGDHAFVSFLDRGWLTR